MVALFGGIEYNKGTRSGGEDKIVWTKLGYFSERKVDYNEEVQEAPCTAPVPGDGLRPGACGNSNKPANSQTPAPGTNTETPAHETETPGETEADPDAIEDSMTSADSKYQVAFVTDVAS